MEAAAVYAITPDAQYGRARHIGLAGVVAMKWQGSGSVWTPISTAQTGGEIRGVSGSLMVGAAGPNHAAVWTAPGQITFLHPPGQWTSVAVAASGNHQFGWTRQSAAATQDTAAMWSGSAQSYINMNPSGAIASFISAAAGDFQGGAAAWSFGGRAGLWNGTPASFVSVHPVGPWTHSWINGMTEQQQVGAARVFPQWPRAAIWHGNAASFQVVDPPESFGYSELLATCGDAQVGYIAPASGVYAGVWFGSAETFHNLHQYLPPGTGESYATCIATDGFRYYIGGYAYYPGLGGTRAILWIGDVPGACYANCDGSTAAPVLNIADFGCFLQRFAGGQGYANCDKSAQTPTLNIADFSCFLQKFVAGCP